MGSPLLLRKLLEARRAPLKLSCIAEMHQIAVIEGIPCLTDHKVLDTPSAADLSGPSPLLLLLDVQTAALSHAYLHTPLYQLLTKASATCACFCPFMISCHVCHSVHATAAETAQELRTGQWLSIWNNASKHYLQLESLLLTCTTWGLCDKEGRPHAPGFQPVALPLRVFCCLTTAPHHAPAGLPSLPAWQDKLILEKPACLPAHPVEDCLMRNAKIDSAKHA